MVTVLVFDQQKVKCRLIRSLTDLFSLISHLSSLISTECPYYYLMLYIHRICLNFSVECIDEEGERERKGKIDKEE